MRVTPFVIMIAVATCNVVAHGAMAQSSRDAPSGGVVTCPPDVKGEPPTIGEGGSKSLSDKLARSNGIICPPAGLDQDMRVAPPGGGQLKVIPPPGSGGDQSLQPK
jgi:hypothetical protein